MNNKIEINELMYALINWIVFVLVITFFLIGFIYVKDVENLEPAFKIIILYLSVGFLIYGVKSDKGIALLEKNCNLIFKDEWISGIVANTPVILFFLWVIIAIYKEPLNWLVNISMISYIFIWYLPIIIGISKFFVRKKNE